MEGTTDECAREPAVAPPPGWASHGGTLRTLGKVQDRAESRGTAKKTHVKAANWTDTRGELGSCDIHRSDWGLFATAHTMESTTHSVKR